MPSSNLPTTHRALVVTEKGKVALKEVPIPKLEDDQVLVRVKAVAINPIDWKFIDLFRSPGDHTGCDFSGDIVAIGSKAQEKAKEKGFTVGTAVAGFVFSGVPSDQGSFQEYVSTLPEMLLRKVTSLPHEDAAPMGGIPLSTAFYGLHDRLQMPLKPLTTPEPFLVWAGSTGVGMYSIKLAALAGYKVVTVASKHNWDLVKSLGASAVFDYKDSLPDIVKNIQQWLKEENLGPIKKGIDGMSEGGSIEKCIEILSATPGSELVTILPFSEDLDKKGVTTHGLFVFEALDPKNEEDFKQLANWYNTLPSYIELGKLSKGIVPLKIYPGGLEDLPEAIDYVRQGKTSGQRVVVNLRSEPSGLVEILWAKISSWLQLIKGYIGLGQ